MVKVVSFLFVPTRDFSYLDTVRRPLVQTSSWILVLSSLYERSIALTVTVVVSVQRSRNWNPKVVSFPWGVSSDFRTPDSWYLHPRSPFLVLLGTGGSYHEYDTLGGTPFLEVVLCIHHCLE